MDGSTTTEAGGIGPHVRTKVTKLARSGYTWELSCTLPLAPGDDPAVAFERAKEAIDAANAAIRTTYPAGGDG